LGVVLRLVRWGGRFPARRALPLTEVVRLAVKVGWDYLIVDGANIPTERVAAQFTAKQHWYCGKHHRHGAAVQKVAAPDGELPPAGPSAGDWVWRGRSSES
jgi:hypothetical protein